MKVNRTTKYNNGRLAYVVYDKDQPQVWAVMISETNGMGTTPRISTAVQLLCGNAWTTFFIGYIDQPIEKIDIDRLAKDLKFITSTVATAVDPLKLKKMYDVFVSAWDVKQPTNNITSILDALKKMSIEPLNEYLFNLSLTQRS